MQIGSLEIEIAANIARLQKDMEDARRVVGGAMGEITKVVDLAKKAFVGFVGVTSVEAFAGMIRGSIDAAGGMHDLAIKTGASVAALSAFKSVAATSDTKIGEIGNAMNRMAKGMSVATEESAGMGQAVAAIGLNFQVLKTMAPDQQMLAVATALDRFQDGAGKSAVAMTLFGKEGAQLLPFLKDLAAESDSVTAKLTEEAVKAKAAQAAMADDFGDNLTKIKKASEGWKKDLAMGMLPALYEASDAFLTVTSSAGGFKSEISRLAGDGTFATWTRGAIIGATYLIDAFEGLWRIVKAVGMHIGAMLATATESLTGIARAAVLFIEGEYSQSWAAVKATANATSQISKDFMSDISATFGAQSFGSKIRERMEEIKGVAAAAKDAKQSLNFDANAAAASDAERKKELELMSQLSGVNRDYMEQLSRLQQLRVSQNMSDERYIELVTDLINKQPGVKAAFEAQAKAMEQVAAFNKQYYEGLSITSKLLDGAVADATKEAEKNEELARSFGLSKAAIEAREVARLEEQLAQRASVGLTVEEIDEIQKLIAAKKRSAEALASVETMEANKKAFDQMVEDAKRSSEQISQSLTDNIMRGGKSAAEYLKDLFRTLILRPVIAPIGSAVGGVLSGMMMPSAAAAAGTDAGGSMLGSAAGSLFGMGGLSGSMMAGAGWMTGATTLSGSLAAAGSLMGTGTAAGVMSGIGMAAGALGPIALAAAGIYALAKSLDRSGTPHTGGAAAATASGVQYIPAELLHFEKTAVSDSGNQFTAGVASNIVAMLNSTAAAFGKTVGYSASTAFADDSSKDGAWGGLVIKNAMQTVLDWQDARGNGQWAPKTFADGEAGQKEYLAEVSRSVRQALDGIGLPAWAQHMLDGLGEGAGLDEMAKTVEAINATQAALSKMGAQLKGFSDLSDGAVAALINAAGGVESLSSGAAAFYQNYYSDEERNAALTKQVADSLAAVNLQMPTTLQGYRALLEAELSRGEAGAASVAVLLADAQAFAQLHPQVKATTEAVQSMKDAASGLLGNADSAFSVLQSVVGREKAALQGRIDAETAIVNKLKGLSDLLHSTLDGMRLPEQSDLDRAGAQAQIKAALAIRKAGGALPDADSLKQALGIVSQSIPGQFASYQDYLRDFYSTKNDIADLARYSDSQLSVEEKALVALQDQSRSLDEMLAREQEQVEQLKGINTTGLSLLQALNGLHAVLLAAQANPVVAAGQAVNSVYQSALGRAPDAAGMQFWQNQAASGTSVADIVSAISNSPEATIRGMYQTMLGRAPDAAGMAFWLSQASHGVSLASIADAFAGSAEVRSLHPFAVGTNFVPETMPALVHQGERIIPAADNRALLAHLSAPAADNRELVQELRDLKAEMVPALQRIASYTNRTAVSNEYLERSQRDNEVIA